MGKVIIAGSRNIDDRILLIRAIKFSGFKISEIVSGGANGVDTLAEKYARANNIKFRKFSADWNQYGKSAGPIRNKKMAEYADALIAIPAVDSKGTKNMIREMTIRNKPVFIMH